MAGEIGHMRLSDYGPAGYGKMGSFEGFCSGGGIAQLARMMIREELQVGHETGLCKNVEELEQITAAQVGIAAKRGDPLALEILKRVGFQLGKGLSVLMDLLNPERIIIGSIFVRNYEEIWPYAEQVIERETLPVVRKACTVLPSQLSESVGDIAGLIVAEYHLGLE
jgi:glucokinase